MNTFQKIACAIAALLLAAGCVASVFADTANPTADEAYAVLFEARGSSTISITVTNFDRKNLGTKPWNGTMYWSEDGKTWNEWTTKTISSSGNKLYVRGTGNSIVSGFETYAADENIPIEASGVVAYPKVFNTSNYLSKLKSAVIESREVLHSWNIGGKDISISGNTEYLLNYSTAKSGGHPSVAARCFNKLFLGNTNITDISNLTLGTLNVSNYAYMGMFAVCDNITLPPKLSATTLRVYSCKQMFYGCQNLLVPMTCAAATCANYCFQQTYAACDQMLVSTVKTDRFKTNYKVSTRVNASAAAVGDMFAFVDFGYEDDTWYREQLISHYGSASDTNSNLLRGTPSGNVTYYVADPAYVQIQYYSNISDANPIKTILVKRNEPVQIPTSGVVSAPKNYTFYGWSSSEFSLYDVYIKTPYLSTDTPVLKKDVKLCPVYKRTISFVTGWQTDPTLEDASNTGSNKDGLITITKTQYYYCGQPLYVLDHTVRSGSYPSYPGVYIVVHDSRNKYDYKGNLTENRFSIMKDKYTATTTGFEPIQIQDITPIIISQGYNSTTYYYKEINDNTSNTYYAIYSRPICLRFYDNTDENNVKLLGESTATQYFTSAGALSTFEATMPEYPNDKYWKKLESWSQSNQTVTLAANTKYSNLYTEEFLYNVTAPSNKIYIDGTLSYTISTITTNRGNMPFIPENEPAPIAPIQYNPVKCDFYANWVDINVAPSIDSNPVGIDQIVYGDTTHSLAVEASNPVGTLSYQWEIAGDDNVWHSIDGANEPTFNIPVDNVGVYNLRCVVTSTFDGSNLSSTSGAASIRIVPLAATLEWSNTSFGYDATEHKPSAIVTNLVGSDQCEVTVSGAQKDVGTHTATASSLSNKNYKIPTDGSQTQTFTIGKKALVVKAKDHTIIYGNEPKDGGVTYVGFEGSDTESVLSGTLAYDITYSQYGDIGSYVITPKGYSSNNYDISYESGTLKVEQREISLVWSNNSFVYDGEEKLPSATAGNLVNGDIIEVTVESPQTKAGSYNAEAVALVGEKSKNYKLPTKNVQISFVINKAAPSFKAYVPQGAVPANKDASTVAGSELPQSEATYVLALGSEQKPVVNIASNSTGRLSLVSADTSKVSVAPLTSLDSEYQAAYVVPVGTTGLAPVKVSVTVEEDDNYKAGEYSMLVYVSGALDTKIEYKTPKALGHTNKDVVATVTVSDIFTKIDKNHTIGSVSFNDATSSLVGGNGRDTGAYQFVFERNGECKCETTDSLGTSKIETLTVDWIDKTPPSIIFEAVGVDTSSGGISMYIQAKDTPSDGDCESKFAELKFCWDYNPNVDPSTLTWSSKSIATYPPGEELTVGVMDKAGNIGTATKAVEYVSVNDVSTKLAIRNNIILKNVKGDISGYVFGQHKYMNGGGTVEAYGASPIQIVIAIEPVSLNTVIEGYMEIGGVKYPVSWYKNEGLTQRKEMKSDDGHITLVKGKSFGKIEINPADFVKRTAKNCTASIILTTYDNTACGSKLAVEKYSMPYAVDLTAPYITTNYNEYSKQLDIRVVDNLVGVQDNKAKFSLDGGGETEIGVVETMTQPTTDGVKNFTFSVSASDTLGNTTTITKTYAVTSVVAPAAGSRPVATDSNINVYETKGRFFSSYMVNGVFSNTELSKIPEE